MNLEINNLQKRLPLNPTILKNLLQKIIDLAEQHNPQRKWENISVLVVDHEQMLPIHEQVFGNRVSTDVISYAYPPLPGEAAWEGELIVNLEMAYEYASPDTVNREFAWYLCHGCLHLTGMDDKTPQLRQEMQNIEDQWLNELDNAKLFQGLSEKK